MALIFTSQGKRRPAPMTLTLEHRGRTRVRRTHFALMLAAGIALVTIGLVAIGLTLALFFKEEILQSLADAGARERSAQREQVATLRAAIDQMSSKHLLDRSRWEGRLTELQQRQALLDSRQSMLASLSGSVSSSKPETTNAGATRAVGVRAANALDAISGSIREKKNLPVDALPETAQSFAPIESQKFRSIDNWGPLRGIGPGASLDGNRTGLPDPTAALASLDASLSQGEAHLLEVIQQTERQAEASRARFAGLLAELSLAPSRFSSATKEPARGGPLVPVANEVAAGSFEASLARLQGRMAEAESMRRVVDALPLRRPLRGEIDQTSGFGYRVDPFTRGLAMHTGIDFRDEWGAPVRATAPGRVTAAEWNGAYGQMVEVEHKGGLATRYAHLSSITVSVGDEVTAGSVVGRLGSTGRSTGPHLHYEMRVDGEAVDPQKWLRVAARAGLD